MGKNIGSSSVLDFSSGSLVSLSVKYKVEEMLSKISFSSKILLIPNILHVYHSLACIHVIYNLLLTTQLLIWNAFLTSNRKNCWKKTLTVMPGLNGNKCLLRPLHNTCSFISFNSTCYRVQIAKCLKFRIKSTCM